MLTSWASKPLTDQPFLQGDGPAECSTSRVLSVVPVCIYDVNGYYRSLGVSPRATRTQLREAYAERGGQSSARLTFVLKQLLNPEVRRAYDRVPFGEVYLDEEVLARIDMEAKKRAWSAQAHQRLAGEPVSTEEDLQRAFYDSLGLSASFDELDLDTPDEVVDNPSVRVQADPSPATFGYAYYLWRTHLRGVDDLTRLAQWQELLVRALDEEGVVTKIAVGLHGGMAHPWVTAVVGFRTVVFLNRDEQPTADLAQRVAARVKQDRTPTSQRKTLL